MTENTRIQNARTQHTRDELGRMRFDWPEPLVIDIIRDLYADLPSFADRMIAARLQADALRDLFEGRDRRAMARRLELIAFSVPRGIGVERIARADRAVLLELTRIVAARFRTSPRTRAELGDALHTALGRLAKHAVPVERVPARATHQAEAA